MSVDLTGMCSGARMRSLQYKFRSYHFNGRNRMRKWDGVAWQKAGITRAEFTPILTASGTGLTGTYKYYVQPVNSTHFNPQGFKVAGIPSFLSSALVVNNQGIAVSNIPATHEDSQVDYWDIYRSKTLDYSQFYYVGTVPIGTTTYTDTTLDSQLGTTTLRTNLLPPPTAKFGVMFGERMFCWGFDAYTTGTATKKNYTINNKALTSNVVTLTTSATHSYLVGEFVTVQMSPADPVLDGCWKITTVTGTTFTYARVNANVGSVGATGVAEQITFSGSSLPDGVQGCWFKATGDITQYRIVQRNSATNVCIAGPQVLNYTGSMSAVAFSVYRQPWEIYISEFQDPEACGPAGESYRWKRELPGYDQMIAAIENLGNLVVFSPVNIYVITGRSENTEDIQLTPSPIYKGLGCVGPRALCAIDNFVYFLSMRGLAVLEGNVPRILSKPINTDWLDSLTGTEMALSQVYTDGYNIWVSVVASGESETSVTYRYDRRDDTWWKEDQTHPVDSFYDDSDAGRYAQVGILQNKLVIQPNTGTYDLVTSPFSGTMTARSNTSMTDSGAAFTTTGSGMTEMYVNMFDSGGVYLGSRRITSNTGTVLTWSSSGTGGGNLTTTAIGCTYEIGKPWWTWKTKTFQSPGHISNLTNMHLTFNEIDATKSVKVTRYYDNPSSPLAAEDSPTTQALQSQIEAMFTLDAEAICFAAKLESRNLATVRQLVLKADTGAEDNP